MSVGIVLVTLGLVPIAAANPTPILQECATGIYVACTTHDCEPIENGETCTYYICEVWWGDSCWINA